ncbi:hypothetical protein Hamer_G017354 [Homarus americanus]|uniref:Uncharacterized protein n=1 Tax=Homarus americanus TaxID=6706 RepID=A0A8J5MQF2_HOMAM|nr:hypothetical protein Hamer_G017354 [Homarus americanus]
MVAIQRWGRSRCWKGAKCCNQSTCAACAKRFEDGVVVGSAVTRLQKGWTTTCWIGVFGMVGGSDGGRGSGYSATEMGAKGVWCGLKGRSFVFVDMGFDEIVAWGEVALAKLPSRIMRVCDRGVWSREDVL